MALQLDPDRIRQVVGQRLVVCIQPLLFHRNIHQLACRVGKGGGDGFRFVVGNRAAHAIVHHIVLCVSGCTVYALQAAAIGGRFFHYLEACANGDAGNFPVSVNWNGFGHCYAVRAAQADTANVAEDDGKFVAAFQLFFAVRLFLFNYQRTDLDGVNEPDLQFGEFFFRRGVTAEHQRLCVWLGAVVAVVC